MVMLNHSACCYVPFSVKGVVKAPDLLSPEGEEPGLVAAGQLWHRLDTSFRQPRAYVRAVMATPVVRDGGPLAAESAKIMYDILHKVRLAR